MGRKDRGGGGIENEEMHKVGRMEVQGCGVEAGLCVCVRDERVWQAGGEDKGRAVFPDVASVLFAAPAPRITAFTLQLKNSPRDNLFSWSSPHCIVFQENGFSLQPRSLSDSFLSIFLYSHFIF